MNISTPLPNLDLPLDGFRVYYDFGFEDSQYDALARNGFPGSKIIDIRGSAITKWPHYSKSVVNSLATFQTNLANDYADRLPVGDTWNTFDGLVVLDNEAWIPSDSTSGNEQGDLSGTHEGANDPTGTSFSLDTSLTAGYDNLYVGASVKNTTTGATSIITGNTHSGSTTTFTHAALSGGTRQDWQTGDAFEINGFTTLAQTITALTNSVNLVRSAIPRAKIGIWGIPTSAVQEDGGAVEYDAADWQDVWDIVDFCAAHIYTQTTGLRVSYGAWGVGSTMAGRVTKALATGLPFLAYLQPQAETGANDDEFWSIGDMVRLGQYCKFRGAFGVAVWTALSLAQGTDNKLPERYVWTGTHTAATSSTTLTDSAAKFPPNDDQLKTATVENVTTGASGNATANTGTTVTVTLTGGSRQDFQSGDEYRIYDHTRYWDDMMIGLAALATK